MATAKIGSLTITMKNEHAKELADTLKQAVNAPIHFESVPGDGTQFYVRIPSNVEVQIIFDS